MDKATQVILVLLSVALVPEHILALETCPAVGQCPPNAQCPEAGAPCECNEGFHQNTEGTVCAADVTPGSTCTERDSDSECVTGAVCVNVAPDVTTEILQCACAEGYQQTAAIGQEPTCKRAPGSACSEENSSEECVPGTTCLQGSEGSEGAEVTLICTCNAGTHLAESNGITACVDDVPPGGECSAAGETSECAENAVCQTAQDNVTRCACQHGFHDVTDTATGSKSCQADLSPGSTCTVKDGEECVENAVCQNTAAEGLPETLQCVCPDAGFHTDTSEGGTTTCEPDVQPGGACSTEDDVTECVADATCVNMTSEGTLQCACNAGYHTLHDDVTGTSSCVMDVSVGGACTMNGSDVECEEGATCKEMTSENNVTSLQCTCMMGYHLKTGEPNSCEKDLPPGSACLTEGGSECVSNAACQNVALTGQPQALQCVCQDGYHAKDGVMCHENLGQGETCSQESECVSHATCTSVSNGDVTSLQCTCDADFHATVNDVNKSVCAEDTCIHTKEKCMAKGAETCDEVTALLQCMLLGKCDAGDAEQVTSFYDAVLQARGDAFPQCELAESTTCAEKVTKCLLLYLNSNTTCGTVDALGTCLTEFQTECMDDNSHKLGTEFMKMEYQHLSCVCLKTSSDCLKTQEANYNGGTDNTTKCSAVKELFSCALESGECDVSKATDHRLLSTLWATALSWATDTGCEDSLQTADTCPLQLTKCALVYADTYTAAGDSRRQQCRSAEAFGRCISDDTGLCSPNDTVTTLFRDQYTLVSSQCLCVTKVTECEDALGQLNQDSVDVCPKVSVFGRCLFGAQCQMTGHNDNDDDDIDILNGAVQTYLHHVTDSGCEVSSNGTCGEDISVCAHTLISKHNSSEHKCSAISDSMLCVNAANCSSDASDDVELMTSALQAARYRLQSLACLEPSCSVTHADLMTCKNYYEDAFNAAGDDASKKCLAKNNMVQCLRSFTCNPHMADLIHFKYEALKNVHVTGCEMISLEDDGDDDNDPNTATFLISPSLTLLGIIVCTVLSAVFL